MSARELIIEGARQNNLKNFSLRLPHDKVIAITGVSGSGKSSLAFDTIFAEGQWRFIESISTYARLFLEKLDRPEVDGIQNIRPAVALEQKNPVRGSRSTVGTLTEIYDYFRLLYSKVSTPYCPVCGREIRKWDTSEVVRLLTAKYMSRKALIVFPSGEQLETLKKRGYRRLLVHSKAVDIDELDDDLMAHLDLATPVDVVLDRLVIRDEARLSDSVEMAWREGNEKVKVMILEDAVNPPAMLTFTSAHACDLCSRELPEPSPLLFSFNHPVGACQNCKGFGNILTYDRDLIVPDTYLSLSEGAIEPWEKPAARWWKRQFIAGAKKAGIDVKKPYAELSQEERELIFSGQKDFYGINDFFGDLEGKRYKLHVRVFLSRYRRGSVCPMCRGKRLQADALSYKISGYDIAELSDMPVAALITLFRDIDLSPFQKDLAKEILRQIEGKLMFLHRVGLDYLTLSRQGRTLSGGEYQRVNLSTQLASYLTGTLYVLDEPTVGLHARDTERIAKIMTELSDMGNTIIVVEHDKGIIEAADWVVELGPGGGQQGGEIVFSGTRRQFLQADTLTSRYVKGVDRVSRFHRSGHVFTGHELVLKNARGNNLKGVNLRIPLGTFTAVTGVSGSGKSSLVVETLYLALAKRFGIERESPLPHDGIQGLTLVKGLKIIDQTPIGRSPRSNPVTYLKIFDHIRKLFSEQIESRAHGYSPGFFSFNVAGGRCEACRGEGYQKMEMYFFEDIYVKCEECGGKRYTPEALRVSYNGRSIVDILDMTVVQAAEVFADVPVILQRLSLMKDVGLGYMRLGQPATTLSGGEAQRLKICAELSSGGKGDFLYILDEPTVGLHYRDVLMLIRVLRRLVDAGNTVVVIEHNLDVIAASDWVVDLGPEGGDEGGRVVCEGRPEEILRVKESYTGSYLKAVMDDHDSMANTEP
ncbi:MAG TPA: excinuclease ABC subunit UvrA [Thermodesulfovibrionales bacterium]|nr:excinuclease ABC subunit UvrA [Thermodesulfovibrionales bacterium]